MFTHMQCYLYALPYVTRSDERVVKSHRAETRISVKSVVGVSLGHFHFFAFLCALGSILSHSQRLSLILTFKCLKMPQLVG